MVLKHIAIFAIHIFGSQNKQISINLLPNTLIFTKYGVTLNK